MLLWWWRFSAHFNGDTPVGYGVTHVQGAQSGCVWRFSQAFWLGPWFMQKSWLAKRVGAVEKLAARKKREDRDRPRAVIGDWEGRDQRNSSEASVAHTFAGPERGVGSESGAYSEKGGVDVFLRTPLRR